MKHLLKILAFGFLLLLLTAENCGLGSPEPRNIETIEKRMFKELETGFVRDELDLESLKAMEKRAIQKFFELFEYLNIYANDSLDVQFRKQAREMISAAFDSENEMQGFFTNQNLTENSELHLLLDSLGEPVGFDIEWIGFEKPFDYSNTGYNGQLKYKLHNTHYPLGVSVRKRIKVFGEEKLMVWELFFQS